MFQNSFFKNRVVEVTGIRWQKQIIHFIINYKQKPAKTYSNTTNMFDAILILDGFPHALCYISTFKKRKIILKVLINKTK